MDSKRIGERIRMRREMLHMTQTDLGDAIGAHKSTIQRYEMGDVERIKLPILDRLAKQLDVDPCWLALKTDTMGEYPVVSIAAAANLSPPITVDEVAHIEKYRTLDAHGKRMVDLVLDEEAARVEADTAPPKMYHIKIAGFDGSFVEKDITEEEADAIRNLPEYDGDI